MYAEKGTLHKHTVYSCKGSLLKQTARDFIHGLNNCIHDLSNELKIISFGKHHLSCTGADAVNAEFVKIYSAWQ